MKLSSIRWPPSAAPSDAPMWWLWWSPLTLHTEAGGGSGAAQLALGCADVGTTIGCRHRVESQCVLLVHLVPVDTNILSPFVTHTGEMASPPHRLLPPPGQIPALLMPLNPWCWVALCTAAQLHCAAGHCCDIAWPPHDDRLLCREEIWGGDTVRPRAPGPSPTAAYPGW